MSLSSDTMMKLMAYADGELEGAARAEVEQLLATDVDAVRFVDQIADLGSFAKLAHEGRDAKVVASFDVAAAVMKSVADTKPAAGKVTSLEAARKKRSSVVVGGIVAALALAASVFFYTRPTEKPLGAGPMALAPQPAEAPAGSPGVEVKAIESPGQDVSVFYLPSGNDLSTSVVVWVDEKTGENR